MNLEEIRELATLALAQPPGLGIPELERNPENFAPYLRFLYDVVDFYRIRMVIECGVYMGTASEYMAIAGGNNVFVIGIDIAPHPHAVNIVYPRHKNLALVHGDTLDIDTFERVGNLVGNDGVGLLFLDSSHDGVTPFMEYKLYKRFFADVCLVVCDDIVGDQLSGNDRDSMQLFWKYMPGEKLELNELHPAYADVRTPGFGVSIIRK